MDDDLQRGQRRQLLGPTSDIGLCIVVEIALVKRRGIERIEELHQLANSHLDRCRPFGSGQMVLFPRHRRVFVAERLRSWIPYRSLTDAEPLTVSKQLDLL